VNPHRSLDEALLGQSPRTNRIEERGADARHRLVEEVVPEAECVGPG
jgi:hypothetical protein